MRWYLVLAIWPVAGSSSWPTLTTQKAPTETSQARQRSSGGSWIQFTGKELSSCPKEILGIIGQIPMRYGVSKQKLVRYFPDKRIGTILCTTRLKTFDVVIVQHDTASGVYHPLISIYERSDNLLKHKYFWSKRFFSVQGFTSGNVSKSGITLAGEIWTDDPDRKETQVFLELPRRYLAR